MVDLPSPSTAAAGGKLEAALWNEDVRDGVQYFVDHIPSLDPRNGFINSHVDIWQSGTSFTIPNSATPTYCADQYAVRRNGATGATVSRQTGPTGQSYTMRVQRDSGNSSTTPIELWQPMDTPDSLRFAGKTVQLRVTLKAGANFSAASSSLSIKLVTGTGTNESPQSTWTGSSDAHSTSQAITTTSTDYVFDGISIPSNATQIKFYASFTPVGTAGTNDWFEISALQLVEGQAYGYQRLPQQQELALCMRYYHQINGSGTDADVGIVGMIFGTAGGTYTWRFPVEMRTAPTLTVDAASSWKVYDGSLQTGTVFTAGTCLTTCASFNLTVASGLTIGRGSKLVCATTSSRIYLNARL